MNKKSLINLAKRISRERGTEKYFEFASNYLMNDSQKGIQTTDNFFKMLKTCTLMTNKVTVRRAFGVSGNDKDNINTWIGNILHNDRLKKLSINELHYVMSTATRYAKIYEFEHPKR